MYVLIVLLLCITPYVFIGGDFAWDAHIICMWFFSAIAWGTCVSKTPYKRLRYKCFYGVLCVHSALCGVYALLALWVPIKGWALLGAHTTVFFLWGAFVLTRSYSCADATLTDTFVYRLRRRPKNAYDFVLAMCADPYGGDALYIRGNVFYYDNGVLHKRDIVNSVEDIEWWRHKMCSRSYHIVKGGCATQDKIDFLNAVVADPVKRKWSWRRNCLTLLAPLAR